jgi:peptidoglycan/xylan/chitin deacetylase (PgdA/CDA1 family)
MGWKRSAADLARRTGAIRAVGARYGKRRLTVVGYHRIADADDPDLKGFAGNVSAAPEAFADQLDWLGRHFEVVGLEDVLGWLVDGAHLPDRAALITFDDGYHDNLDVAAPLLATRGMPATLFLTTGPTDGGPALYWDRVASVFAGTEPGEADLPVLGHRTWGTAPDRCRTVHDFVYATKWLPPEERTVALDRLEEAVGRDASEHIPGLYLDWDGVRSLRGWAIGSHTVRHPVLTSIPAPEAAGEIAVSAGRITEETGRPVRSLAYPNGLTGDFDDGTAAAARSAGIDIAFTLRPGPARLAEVRADPLAVRRVCIGFRDGPGTFAAKAMGAFRMLETRG